MSVCLPVHAPFCQEGSGVCWQVRKPTPHLQQQLCMGCCWWRYWHGESQTRTDMHVCSDNQAAQQQHTCTPGSHAAVCLSTNAPCFAWGVCHGVLCRAVRRGYLNFGTLYICWLCSAVFCHLPSFEALGIDIKADVSLGLSIAASSFLVSFLPHQLRKGLKLLVKTVGHAVRVPFRQTDLHISVAASSWQQRVRACAAATRASAPSAATCSKRTGVH